MKQVLVTTRLSNSIVRKGETKRLPLDKRTKSLIEAGVIDDITPKPKRKPRTTTPKTETTTSTTKKDETKDKEKDGDG